MAKIKGKMADFCIDTAEAQPFTGNPPFNYGDGGMVRIETLSNEVVLNTETTTVDTSAYGDDFDQFEVITYRWSVDITAYVDDGATNTEAIFMTGLLALGKYPFCLSINGKPGGEASATQPKYSGRVIIESANFTPERGNVSRARIRLRGDGQLARSTS
jgi:hypothetical protein